MTLIKRFHRWIDDAWVAEGLLNANVRYPPWRLLWVPCALIAAIFPLDVLVSHEQTKNVITLGIFGACSSLQLCFGWRLMYLSSMTEISQQLARGEEPDPAQIRKFTE
jgi:hypothetical protein